MISKLSWKHWLLAIATGLFIGGICITPMLYVYQNYLRVTRPPLVTPTMLQTFHQMITPPTKNRLKKDLSDIAHLKSMEVRVSFYTGLAIENGGYTELNALGSALEIGSLAAPGDIPFGTEFYIEDLPSDVNTSRFIVDDRGGAIQRIHQNKIKVDVYVKRFPGETDNDYFTRVNQLGIIHTTALYKFPN